MTYIEEQARQKWCPMVRTSAVAYTDGGTDDFDNRGKTTLTPEAACCIASDCMAWRWETPGEDMGRQYVDPGAERNGYCGLARKS